MDNFFPSADFVDHKLSILTAWLLISKILLLGEESYFQVEFHIALCKINIEIHETFTDALHFLSKHIE